MREIVVCRMVMTPPVSSLSPAVDRLRVLHNQLWKNRYQCFPVSRPSPARCDLFEKYLRRLYCEHTLCQIPGIPYCSAAKTGTPGDASSRISLWHRLRSHNLTLYFFCTGDWEVECASTSQYPVLVSAGFLLVTGDEPVKPLDPVRATTFNSTEACRRPPRFW